MKYVNNLGDINITLKFCREYGFLAYDLILRCRDEILILKSEDKHIVLKSMLNKYSYLDFVNPLFGYLLSISNSVKEGLILIGKMLSLVGISDTMYKLEIEDIDINFVKFLERLAENERFTSYTNNNIQSHLALYIVVRFMAPATTAAKQWAEDSITNKEDIEKWLKWKIEEGHADSILGATNILKRAYDADLNGIVMQALHILEEHAVNYPAAMSLDNIPRHSLRLIKKIVNDMSCDKKIFGAKFSKLYDIILKSEL